MNFNDIKDDGCIFVDTLKYNALLPYMEMLTNKISNDIANNAFINYEIEIVNTSIIITPKEINYYLNNYEIIEAEPFIINFNIENDNLQYDVYDKFNKLSYITIFARILENLYWTIDKTDLSRFPFKTAKVNNIVINIPSREIPFWRYFHDNILCDIYLYFSDKIKLITEIQ